MIQAAVVGGSGYTGVELLRLLFLHPQIQVKTVTSRAEAGKPLIEHYPHFIGQPGAQAINFSEPIISNLKAHDLVFFATPNGTAMTMAQELLDAGVKIIDLAADFRFKTQELWHKWYQLEHLAPNLLTDAVYGLADLAGDAISQARLVANPGCFPTAVQLGLKPLVDAGMINMHNSVIADCKSGISGAGRSSQVIHSYSEVEDNFQAYNVNGHRHWPEIKAGLMSSARVPEEAFDFTFVPHLLPMTRGILATIYFTVTDEFLETNHDPVGAIKAHLIATYKHSPFVWVLPGSQQPLTKSVRGSNMCHINVFRAASGQFVLVSVIDNLVKGAAGQAVQNCNLMFALPESMGLMSPGLTP